VISFNATISVCAKERQWQHALALLHTIPKALLQPDVVSFGAAVGALEKATQWLRALGVFGGMTEASQADVVPNEIIFNSTISSCAKSGEWQQALALCSLMPDGRATFFSWLWLCFLPFAETK
ncbi:unnamed protein product, partial [Effrenium voratum]